MANAEDAQRIASASGIPKTNKVITPRAKVKEIKGNKGKIKIFICALLGLHQAINVN